MTVPLVRLRAKRPKTRTGCRTCKARRVKCDEERPACRKCSASGRECGGYEVSLALATKNENGKRPLLPGRSMEFASLATGKPTFELSSPYSANEWYAVDIFRGQSIFQLPGCSMVNSWETLALRLSHSEPAIRSAIIALGSLHRARGSEPPSTISPPLEAEQYRFALQHYAQAVSNVQKRLDPSSPGPKSDNIEVTLLACLMFMTFELLQGSYALALQHRAIGLKILGEHLEGSVPQGQTRHTLHLSTKPSSAIEILAQAFASIDYDMTMSGTLIPALHVAIEDGLPHQREAFDSPEEARMHLTTLTNAVYRTKAALERLATQEISTLRIMHIKLQDKDHLHCWTQARGQKLMLDDQPELRAAMSEVEQSITDWSSAFACMAPPKDEAETAMRMMLQVQFMSSWVLASPWRGAGETKYDRFYPVFCQTITVIEQLLALRPDHTRPDFADQQRGVDSLWRLVGRGTGINLALYLVAVKCRDSAVRWKALALLHSLNIQEGFLSSNLMAPIAQKMVVVEEARARRMTGILGDQPLACRDVPEESRTIEVTINANQSDAGLAGVVLSTSSAAWPGFVIEEHWFSLSENRPTAALGGDGSVRYSSEETMVGDGDTRHTNEGPKYTGELRGVCVPASRPRYGRHAPTATYTTDRPVTFQYSGGE